MESLSNKKRVRSESDDSEPNSLDAKRFHHDLLDILEDSNVCTVSPDLDSFMKSFEDEISKLPETVADGGSDSGEHLPDLGFLFEASDDELGLPPTNVTATELENERVTAESVEIGELWGLDDQISSYDSFEYGFGYAGGDGGDVSGCNDGEYVALDGLFDYTDVGFGSPELARRPESLPAQGR